MEQRDGSVLWASTVVSAVREVSASISAGLF